MQMMEVMKAIDNFLHTLSLDSQDPNLEDTPRRVAEMWIEFLFPTQVELRSFPVRTPTGLIVFKNHEAWGFCPHHLLPVRYTFKVGYLPKSRQVIGASKVPRLVNEVLKCLPLQEEIPGLIGKELNIALQPRGVGVICEGEHQCTRIRGVRSPCLSMANDYMSGELLDEGPTREEFFLL